MLPGPSGDSERAVAGYLAAVRRRRIASSLLGLTGWAALLNEAYRWGAAALSGVFPALPQLPVGLYFALAASLPTGRRWPLARAAALADRRLRFHDRLQSFLDFAARPDVPQAFRRAQAAETAASLAGKDPGRSFPLRGPLLVCPLLLAVSLTYPMLARTSLTTPSFRGGIPGASRRAGPTAGPGGVTGTGTETGTGTSTAPTPGHEAPAAGQGAPAPADKPGDGAPPPHGETAGGKAQTGEQPAPQGPGQQGGELPTSGPAASYRVGKKPTPVVDPVLQPAQRRPPAAGPPRGSVTYRLFPAGADGEGRPGGPGRGGQGGGGRSALTIDYESVPPRYRALVEGYFTRFLAASTTPERSGRE